MKLHRRACRLKLFVYTLGEGGYDSFIGSILQLVESEKYRFTTSKGFAADNSSIWARATRNSCLFAPCQFSSFIWANTLAFTSEVVVYERLLRTCPIVADPLQADAFVVPAWLGLATVLGWNGKRSNAINEWMGRLASPEISRWLPHLTNASAPRHVFFDSVDSQFVWLGNGAPKAETVKARAIWLHLGDDERTGQIDRGSLSTNRKRAPSWHIRNALVLPYRISHWLPRGFPPPAVPIVRKRWLLYANINHRKHKSRSELVASLRAQGAGLSNGSSARDRWPRGLELLRLRESMVSVPQAADEAALSVFCLCPTGDSKGFTARLYFSIVHGCIPIRLDGFRRAIPPDKVPWPFPSLIDWSRVVTDVPESGEGALLSSLLAMRPEDVEARRRYMRSISHWLVTDRDDVRLDAADAAIIELERRLLGAAATERSV